MQYPSIRYLEMKRIWHIRDWVEFLIQRNNQEVQHDSEVEGEVCRKTLRLKDLNHHTYKTPRLP